jgi:CubicO group peptidase (beta-lactamase class C family)
MKRMFHSPKELLMSWSQVIRKLFAAQTAGCLLLCFAASVVSAQTPGSGASFEGFDAFAQQVLKDWNGAGFAIAVIKDGKVIYAKGEGLRDVKNNQAVTTKTLFAIGSSTKSFTVTSLGVLVDQGKLDWDKPVRQYLPDFQLMDEFATERMTPRDLVTHRSGLPRHDRMWLNSPFTRQEIYERMRYLEPNKDFRTTFQYQNLMFMTAGYLAGHVAGMPWEDHVRKVIFEPLGMSSTNFSVKDMEKSADHSEPYTVVKEQIREMPFRNIDTIGPAGSINSNVEDMAKYVTMHMQHGKGIISLKNSREMQSPQMSIGGPSPENKEIGSESYGMGFFLTSYRGHYLVHHGGNIDGFTALVTFMPQDNIGMIILSNQNASQIPTVVSYNVYDRLLGMDQIEWTKRLKTRQERGRAGTEEAKLKGYTAQVPGTHPSHDLAGFAGEYESPAYGLASVALANGALEFNYHGDGGPLNHYHYDVFEVGERELGQLSKLKVTFHTNLMGDVDSLSVPFEASVKEIVFSRLPDRRMKETTFLRPLTGTYQRGAATVTVAMQGDHAITMSTGGQPAFELEPVRGTRFNIKGQNGSSVEFKGDDLVFYTANNVSMATRQK